MPTLRVLSYPAYFERRYCLECCAIHWLEVTPTNREHCHGADFQPTRASLTHYARRTGKGFTLRQKMSIPLPIEWTILAERPAVLDEVDF